MKNAVFFDIDGTLWNEHMQIPKSTAASIRALREIGSYAFICSGRSRSNIQNKSLLDIGFDGVVAACGAHIDFHGEMAYETLLTTEQTAHALSVIRRHHMSVVLEGPNYIYADEDDFFGDPYVSYLRKELGENLKSISGNTDFEINKMSAGLKEADIGQVIKELGDAFDVIVHDEHLIEIIPAGHSKATGIQEVCRLLDISHENTYAFGDSANDLEMLRYVAHGIAMGNGTQEAKQAAEYTTSNIENDGIKNGLQYFNLI